MIKKLLLGLAIVIVVTAALAATKTAQIQKMIGMAQPEQMEAIATAVATEEKWAEILPAVGTVTPVQGVIVTPEIPGIVSEIAFESGAVVKQGDLLVRLDTSSEEAQLRAVEAQTDLARLNAERMRKLASERAVSQSEMDTAEATLKQFTANADAIRAAIAKKTIRAPFAGRLGIRQVNLGELLPAGKGIVSLQSLSPVFVDFSLPQQELSLLKTGLAIRARSDSYKDMMFTGTLAAISPEVDVVTRSVRLRARFENTDQRLCAGMFVRVEVELPDPKPVLAIPGTAILTAPYGDSVFVITPETTNGATRLVAQSRIVRTGRTQGDFISITDGLKAGDRVATAGIFKLRNNMTVRENNDLAPKPSHNPVPPNT